MTSSNGRRHQTIKSGISHQPLIGPYSNLKLMLIWPNHILQIFKMKKTSNGRRPQNIKKRISPQSLIGSYSNFKLKLRWPNYILQIIKMKMTSGWPQEESVALLSPACSSLLILHPLFFTLHPSTFTLTVEVGVWHRRNPSCHSMKYSSLAEFTLIITWYHIWLINLEFTSYSWKVNMNLFQIYNSKPSFTVLWPQTKSNWDYGECIITECFIFFYRHNSWIEFGATS